MALAARLDGQAQGLLQHRQGIGRAVLHLVVDGDGPQGAQVCGCFSPSTSWRSSSTGGPAQFIVVALQLVVDEAQGIPSPPGSADASPWASRRRRSNCWPAAAPRAAAPAPARGQVGQAAQGIGMALALQLQVDPVGLIQQRHRQGVLAALIQRHAAAPEIARLGNIALGLRGAGRQHGPQGQPDPRAPAAPPQGVARLVTAVHQASPANVLRACILSPWSGPRTVRVARVAATA